MNGGSDSFSAAGAGGARTSRLGEFGGVVYGNMAANFTSEQPRGGSRGVFAVDVLEITGSTVLSVKIQHRNSEETSWADAASFSSINATGIKIKIAEEIKELVRLSLTVSSGGGGDISARVRLFEPVWQA